MDSVLREIDRFGVTFDVVDAGLLVPAPLMAALKPLADSACSRPALSTRLAETMRMVDRVVRWRRASR